MARGDGKNLRGRARAQASSFPGSGEPYRCPCCGEAGARIVPSGKTGASRCTLCLRYDRLVSHAKAEKRVQSYGAGGERSYAGAALSRSEFLAFMLDRADACEYCGIPLAAFVQVGLRDQYGNRLRTLGIDRLDNRRGYEPGNIRICCHACNQIKSARWQADEIDQLAPAIAASLWQRLHEQGVETDWRCQGRLVSDLAAELAERPPALVNMIASLLQRSRRGSGAAVRDAAAGVLLGFEGSLAEEES